MQTENKMKIEQSFADWCISQGKENLLKEWDYGKNVVQPQGISSGSNKKVFWKCSLGHEWECQVYLRKTAGCPYCANRRVWPGYNDLATLFPDISKEWDYGKNDGLRPEDVVSGSGKRVFWKCSNGHSFATSISNRTSQGTGCPYCSKKRMLKGYNDLETINPTFLQEWDYEKNTDVLPSGVSLNSKEIVWWKCSKCDYSWKASVANRNKGRGCPICSKEQGIKKKNETLLGRGESFAEAHSELLVEWDYEKNNELEIHPENVLVSSNKTVWWKCKNCGNNWKAIINNRSKGIGCPICGREKAKESRYETLIETHKSLGEIDDPILKDWDYEKNVNLSPFDVLPYSREKVWWKCDACGNEWQASVQSRIGHRCPRCTKELHTSFPEQALFYYISKVCGDVVNGDRSFGFELDIFIPSLRKAVEYDGGAWHKNLEKDLRKNQLCKENGVYLYRIRESKCPEMRDEDYLRCFIYDERKRDNLNAIIKRVCYEIFGEDVDVDINRDNTDILDLFVKGKKEKNLETLYPNLVHEWDYSKNGGVKPSMVMPKSSRKYWWLCAEGHSYATSPMNRTTSKGCPYCNNVKVITGYNDLATTNPSLALEWDYSKNIIGPQDVFEGSNKAFWWKCKTCGNGWKATLNSRSGGKGCPYCSGRLAIVGKNDISVTHPQIFEEWDYERNGVNIQPQNYKAGSNKKVWWKCKKCGNSWKAVICSRTRDNGTGCPYCYGRECVEGFNDLKSQRPELAKEWDYSKNEDKHPANISISSSQRVWWVCSKCGFEWSISVASRAKRGSGCPQCAKNTQGNRYLQFIANRNGTLEEENPDYLMEWDYKKNDVLGLSISLLTSGSHERAWWKCSNCGNEWQTSIVVRKKGHGCPKCNHKEGAKKSIEKKKELGIKTLADVNSAFLKEWDFEKNKGYSLEMFLPNSGKRVWWKCSICGNEWQAKIIDRNKKGTGCPLCANNKSHNTKKVINLDTKEVFESLAEASERSGTSDSNICSNLKGKTKKAGGYRWAYYS